MEKKFILYHCDESYASQKVRVYFSEKNIEWKSHHIDVLKQEHIIDQSYKLIHPRGLVPALKDGENSICGSSDIMQYVFEKYCHKEEIKNSNQNHEAYVFCKNDELLHDPHIRVLSYHYLWMAKAVDANEQRRIVALAEKHPDKARGEFLARAIQRSLTSEELELARNSIYLSLEELENSLALSKSNYIYNNEYTMADATATVRLFRLGQLNINIEALSDQYPLTAAYYAKMKQRLSFNEINSSYKNKGLIK